MELTWVGLQQFADEHARLLIFLLSTFAFAGLGYVAIVVARISFALYRRQFYSQVDQGLRDVFMLIDPGQVFAVTIGLGILICPLLFFFVSPFSAVVGGMLIMFAPRYVLLEMKKNRSDKFVKQMPDALAAMSTALKSGLNLVKSLQQVVRNQPEPLAQEFAQVLVEYRIGTDLNDSFGDLAKRIDRPEVVLMNSAIRINRSVGGNLAATFENLADSLRETSKVEGKIKAMTAMGSSQGKLALAVPIVVALVFFQQERAAMEMLFHTKLGWIWLGMMVFSAFLGMTFIKKIVNVDV
ncbi:type II secretion system protein F [gamma proteobacterium HdN1]|nr:type II secretion system protein F [gamma proteobacterium HdN1]